jgi:hypothetical protein
MNEYLAWFDGACEPVNLGGTGLFRIAQSGVRKYVRAMAQESSKCYLMTDRGCEKGT